jgi:hypothetical protein
MRTKLIFTLAFTIALGTYSLELHLITLYKPTAQLFEHMISVTGRIYFIGNGHLGGWTPQVNGIPFKCAADYLSPDTNCPDRVPMLKAGMVVTAAMAYVPGALRDGYVAMSISLNGKQVYARTPQQVIDDYTHSSGTNLLGLPFFLLLVFGVAPWLCFKFLDSVD